MRVLVVSSEFPPGPGGIGTHAYELARGLGKLGWEVTALVKQDYVTAEEAEAFNREQTFPVVVLPRGVWMRSRALGRRIGDWKPNLVVASGDKMIYLTAWAARGRPWVAVEHGRSPAGWERGVKRWALERATGVVGVSRYTWQRMVETGVRPQKGQVISNGADPERFRILPNGRASEARRSLGLDRARLLITVGNVTARKGQDVVIRALPHILKRVPDTHYLMAGLPTRQQEFAALAGELGVAERVHFLGRVEAERLVGLLNAADVFTMTSRHAGDQFEGYGIAVTEAALCGLPAVVTGESGLREAIVEGETGLAAPEDGVVAVAQAVVRLLEDEDRRRTMGEAARRRALAEQTWESRVREYDTFFRSLLCSC